MPSVPNLAYSHSAAGATEFARYWFLALGLAYKTTDSSLARSLSLPSCVDCRHFLNVSIDSVRARGGHFKGGHILVTATKVVPAQSRGSRCVVDVTIDQSAIRTTFPNGNTGVTPAIKSKTFRTWLLWRGGSWRVAKWKQAVS